MKIDTDKEIFSVSGWEKSDFGGYKRVIRDHPYVYVPFEIDWKRSNKVSDLSQWLYDDLIRIFLLIIVKENLIDNFMSNASMKQLEMDSFYSARKKKRTCIVISKTSVYNCISHLTDGISLELAPMFKHYRKEIGETKFYMNTKSSKERKDEDGPFDDFIKKMQLIKSFDPGYSRNLCSGYDKGVEFSRVPKLNNETQYYPDEVFLADGLHRHLDINFESKDDVIHSQRNGKLDVKKISQALTGDMFLYQRVETDQLTRPFSVVILADESGSMEYNSRYKYQYTCVKSLYHCLRRSLPEDKLFIYGHSGDEKAQVFIYHEPGYHNFDSTIEQMFLRGDRSQNYDGPVIEAIHKRVREMTSDRILFLSISDGAPEGCDYGGTKDEEEMKMIIEKCRRDDFVTVGIGIGEHQTDGLYSYSVDIHDTEQLPRAASRLINKVVKTEFQ